MIQRREFLAGGIASAALLPSLGFSQNTGRRLPMISSVSMLGGTREASEPEKLTSRRAKNGHECKISPDYLSI